MATRDLRRVHCRGGYNARERESSARERERE